MVRLADAGATFEQCAKSRDWAGRRRLPFERSIACSVYVWWSGAGISGRTGSCRVEGRAGILRLKIVRHRRPFLRQGLLRCHPKWGWSACYGSVELMCGCIGFDPAPSRSLAATPALHLGLRGGAEGRGSLIRLPDATYI